MVMFRTCLVQYTKRTLCTSHQAYIKVKYPHVKIPTLPNLEAQSSKKAQLKLRVFERFFNYLSQYDLILKKVLPGPAVRAIELFTQGTKLLFSDMKDFALTHRVLASSTADWERACKSLTRKQLELYLTLPPDLFRVAPVLLISALPLAQNIIFPLALMFPKRMLSSHFWNDEQWYDVHQDEQKLRQKHYPATLKHMIKVIESQPNLSEDHLRFVKLLKNGEQPSVMEIMQIKDLFFHGPLSLSKLQIPYVRHLIKMHNVSGLLWWYFPRYKLRQQANIVRQIDLAILREGVDCLDIRDLASACFLRGINCKDMEESEALAFVRDWISVSAKLDRETTSLLIHLPVILGVGKSNQFWRLE